MAVVAGPGEADDVARRLEADGEPVYAIGRIEARPEAGPRVEIDNLEATWTR
jgi:phosphoribosylaminoimidazole (AIR) synthetase